jgi:hypothetical protein
MPNRAFCEKELIVVERQITAAGSGPGATPKGEYVET